MVWLICSLSKNKRHIFHFHQNLLNNIFSILLHWFGLVTKSCRTLVAPWTLAHQAPLSMGFSRQEYWSGLPFPSPEGLPYPGIEPRSSALQADSLPSETPGKPRILLYHQALIYEDPEFGNSSRNHGW